MSERNEIKLAGTTLGRQRHLCAFFNNLDEEIEVLLPFFAEGLERGEKFIGILAPKQRAEYLRRLEQLGLDVRSRLASGQLELWSWEDPHPRDGRFDKEGMLKLLPETFERARSEGYPLTRLVANMEWALERLPTVQDVVEYEARIEAVLQPYADPTVCVYDSSKFGGRVVLDLLRTHRVAIVGGVLHENPFYLPAAEFLEELRVRHG